MGYGMAGADIVKGPIGMLIGLSMWLFAFPLLIGAVNGWYMQSADACVIDGERFDRVVVAGSNDTKEAWEDVTSTSDGSAATPSATTAYLLEEKTGDKCNIGDGTAISTSTKFYTPIGTEVTSVAGQAEVTGAEWAEAGTIFDVGGFSGLIEIILQAAGLAIPVALLMALGSFGHSFLRNMGLDPILSAIFTVIAFLLLSTLLNVFIPFVSDAFNAIDSNRFLMYDEGLGVLADVIGNFYGVVIVASIMMVAWKAMSALRGRDALRGSQSM